MVHYWDECVCDVLVYSGNKLTLCNNCVCLHLVVNGTVWVRLTVASVLCLCKCEDSPVNLEVVVDEALSGGFTGSHSGPLCHLSLDGALLFSLGV